MCVKVLRSHRAGAPPLLWRIDRREPEDPLNSLASEIQTVGCFD
jgi:hypothetical protein